MKTVFRNSGEVAHIWAQQNQEHGRSSNCYFDGPVIYSYGSHYPLGIILQRGKVRAALINGEGYGVTTSGHIQDARRATEHYKRFTLRTGETKINGTEVAREFANFAKGYIEPATLSARVSQHIIERAAAHIELMQSPATMRRRPDTIHALHAKFLAQASIIGEALVFVKSRYTPAALGALRRVANMQNMGAEKLAAFKAKTAAAEKLRKEREAAEQAERRAKINEQLALALPAWLAGADTLEHEGKVAHNIGYFIKTHAESIHMRVKGDEVETTLGARFPLDHGLKALPVIRAVVASGETWVRNGKTIHLGPYQVDMINPAQGIIKAGCHTLPISEVERLAASLGV